MLNSETSNKLGNRMRQNETSAGTLKTLTFFYHVGHPKSMNKNWDYG